MADHAPPARAPMGVVVVASVSAEVTTKSTFYPLDTLKTRLQYQRRSMPRGAPRLLLLQDLFEAIALLRSEPPLAMARSMYRGLFPAVVGAVPTTLIYMPTYELVKPVFADIGLAPAAGVVTGMVSCVVRVPVSVIKSRMQLQMYTSTLDALRNTSKLGLYVGFGATMVLDVSYAVVQFGVLEQLSGWRRRGNTSLHDWTTGFLAGAAASVCTEPIDVVRTRIMTQTRGTVAQKNAETYTYRGVIHGFQCVVAQEGLGALWKGLLPRLLLKSCSTAMWYSVYIGAQHRLLAYT